MNKARALSIGAQLAYRDTHSSSGAADAAAVLAFGVRHEAPHSHEQQGVGGLAWLGRDLNALGLTAM